MQDPKTWPFEADETYDDKSILDAEFDEDDSDTEVVFTDWAAL